MDAFFASVEIRDNPSLKGKPVIIGSLPNERGVVSTCNYEARKFGIHSAMNIKEAYHLCSKGIYIHPHYEKYQQVSQEIHKIWDDYAIKKEAIALDEAYLDITERVDNIDSARTIAQIIKKRIQREIGLTCSVGLAYCKVAAKTASEEKKPNGYFEILTPQAFLNLVIDRNVNCLYTVGKKTTQKLNEMGIYTIRDIQENKNKVIKSFGKRGELIVNLAFGIDERELKSYRPEEAKSMSREVTFQKDVNNEELLKDVLFLLALCVEKQLKKYRLHGNGVTLKITYADRKTITRSKIVDSCNYAIEMQKEAIKLLEQIEFNKIRLIGIGVYNLSKEEIKQLSFDDLKHQNDEQILVETSQELARLENKYHLEFTKNIPKLYKMETFFKTIEYMRKHSYKGKRE